MGASLSTKLHLEVTVRKATVKVITDPVISFNIPPFGHRQIFGRHLRGFCSQELSYSIPPLALTGMHTFAVQLENPEPQFCPNDFFPTPLKLHLFKSSITSLKLQALLATTLALGPSAHYIKKLNCVCVSLCKVLIRFLFPHRIILLDIKIS